MFEIHFLIPDIFKCTFHDLKDFSSCAIRWDIEALETLPEYMKICYLALFTFVHEVSYDTLKDYG